MLRKKSLFDRKNVEMFAFGAETHAKFNPSNSVRIWENSALRKQKEWKYKKMPTAVNNWAFGAMKIYLVIFNDAINVYSQYFFLLLLPIHNIIIWRVVILNKFIFIRWYLVRRYTTDGGQSFAHTMQRHKKRNCIEPARQV